MITVKLETPEQFKNDAIPLFQADWDETNIHANKTTLKINYEKYELLYKAGKLLIVAARDDEKLVGYLLFGITGSMHHSELVASSIGLYVIKEYRGCGVAKNLIESSINIIKKTKIKKICINTAPINDIGPMLKPHGFELEQKIYSIVV